MDFSIFDLYATAPKSGEKAKLRHGGVHMHAEKRNSESPDSMQWEDSNDSEKHPIPHIPAEKHHLRLQPSSDYDSTFFFKPPPLIPTSLEAEETHPKLPNISRTSIYGPVRNWPMNMRASRYFVTTHGYQDNLRLLDHYGPQPSGKPKMQAALDESKRMLNQSLSHPKLAPLKPKPLRKSMPSDSSECNKTTTFEEKKSRTNALHRRQFSLALLDHLNSSKALGQSCESTPQGGVPVDGSFDQVSRKAAPVIKTKLIKGGKKPPLRRSL